VPDIVTSADLDEGEAFSAAVTVTAALVSPDKAENESQPPELSAILHTTSDEVMVNASEELFRGLRKSVFGLIERDCPLIPDKAGSNRKAINKAFFIIIVSDVLRNADKTCAS